MAKIIGILEIPHIWNIANYAIITTYIHGAFAIS